MLDISYSQQDHLIGLLSSLAQSAGSNQRRAVLLARAMDVCQFVLDNVVDSQGWPNTALLPMELHRLQRVYFTSASLSSNDTQDAASDYFKALELVIRPPSPYSDDELYTARELILASYVLGLSLSGNPLGLLPEPVQNALHLNELSFSAILDDPYLNIFRMVRAAGDELVTALLQEGGGALPFLLLLPDQVARLPALLFRTSNGILPAICERRSENGTLNLKDQAALQHTNLMTTTILLTLAKRYQDQTYVNVRVPQFSGTLNVNHSLSILFYYLATAFVPAASTYNNMGIVLATVASSRSHIDDAGVQQTLNGPTLAKVYYEAGLQIDGEHPHLLTNLGSLYKDQGHVEKAIQCVKPCDPCENNCTDLSQIIYEGCCWQTGLRYRFGQPRKCDQRHCMYSDLMRSDVHKKSYSYTGPSLGSNRILSTGSCN